MCFLVLWSICWSLPLAHFKNSPKYLTKETAQVFILLMRFLPHSLASSSFLVPLSHSFLNFLSFPHVWWSPLPIFLSTCKFPFLPGFWLFPNLVVLFSPSFVVFCFSLSAWHIFLCQILSLYPDSVSLPSVLGFRILFSFFGKQFDVVYIHLVVNLCLLFMKFAFAKYVVEWHHSYHK